MPASSDLSADYRRYVASIVLFHLSAADAVGVGATDYQAWNVLALDGPLTSGELARRLGLTTGATTRLVDRLEATGAARRVPDPADRRRVLVESTGAVPDRLAEILAAVREPIGRALGGLDAAQREGAAAYFRAAAETYRDASRSLR
ncbi:MarR family winged helix-turn-helix transcriptional regulator [Streptomyces avicenniae]|uniref:MarR family winged helix-turn-helix transcriptional regulator n=1 Tax=Streptomyces avicenniae TaxID=500153 RepID=UPI00069A4089|nr:MarR family transcriptional regulator [Streptomyces avicenniae]